MCGTVVDSALHWHDFNYKPVTSQKCCSGSLKVSTATVRLEKGGGYFLQQVGQVWKWAELLSFMLREPAFTWGQPGQKQKVLLSFQRIQLFPHHKSFIGHLWAKDFFLYLRWRSRRILLNLFQVCMKLWARNVCPILFPLSVIVSTTPSSAPDCLTSVMCPLLLRSIWNLIRPRLCVSVLIIQNHKNCLQHTFLTKLSTVCTLSLPLFFSLWCCFKG